MKAKCGKFKIDTVSLYATTKIIKQGCIANKITKEKNGIIENNVREKRKRSQRKREREQRIKGTNRKQTSS